MCLPQIQPRYSLTNVCILWGKPARDKSLEFRPSHLTFHNLMILNVLRTSSQRIPA